MVTYMEPHTVPTYISVKCTRRTLRMPRFTRVPHAQPSLSNFTRRDSDFGEPTRSRGTTRLKQNFPTSPQNKKTKLTHRSLYMSLRTISTPRVPHAQPSLSNFTRRDSDFGEPTRSRGTTRLKQNFPTSPQNKKTKLTHRSLYMSLRTISTPYVNSICHIYQTFPTK